MAADDTDLSEMLAARIRVPDHVVHREFADDTVILNLESGMYHGINATGARMLEALQASASVDVAIDTLSSEFEQPRDVIERDVLSLCRTLEERGLIIRHGGAGAS
jgi:coenzyme PQQ synthesis protein D (PqqD)